jgi:5'-nucleotidase
VNVNFPHPPADFQALPERCWCAPELAPLGVGYRAEKRSDGAMLFHYSAVYNERPRRPGSDVDVCFGGKISISRFGVDGAACG